MKPFTKIVSTLFLVCIIPICAQQISFENINSNNALAIISQIQSVPQSAKNSVTKTIQYGNKNYAEISTNNKAELSTSQIGEYNYLNFNNSFEKESQVKSTITAQGNNNIIDITGSNSISEKMQIHVKGDNKTIFIRNY